jgi:NitT/TauT family transport system substrate-binding protein
MKKLTYVKMCAVALGLIACAAGAEPLKIAYSDWPGWVAWDIAKAKGFFEKHDVEVELKWFDYMPSMDAFAAGQVDGVSVAHVDSLVLNATGARNIMILLNDYSYGNDKIVAAPGINSIKDLKGKKVAVEVGVVSHLFLIKALEANGMTEADVTIVNTPNHQTAQVFASGAVDAVSAWQPASGQALKAVTGSTQLFTSKNVPGLIYDSLVVSPKSLMQRQAEWEKVIAAWYDVVDYMADPANKTEILEILSARVSLTPDEYEPLLEGTKILSRAESLKAFEKRDDLFSIYGSLKVSDEFFVKSKIYDEPVNIDRTVNGAFTRKVLK